jgi:hypothetical protein
VRLVGLDLPPTPSKNNDFYKKSLSKPIEWHLWLRAKAMGIMEFIINFRPTRADPAMNVLRNSWFVMVDDDTYIKVGWTLTQPCRHFSRGLLLQENSILTCRLIQQINQLSSALSSHNFMAPIAVGRKFTCKSKGALLGGGPGIAMSRGAINMMRLVNCPRQDFPILSRTVSGGDGWLGQCLTHARVVMINDWRFKSLPPMAFAPNQQAHAVLRPRCQISITVAIIE